MSGGGRKPSVFERVDERPRVSLARARGISAGALWPRFVAGALTSVCAGAVSLIFGPRAGGVLLGFPAILAASLTLIASDEDAAHAREDARGAIVGALGMAAFAATGLLLVDTLLGGFALVIAAAVWVLVALGLYGLLWWK